MLERIALYVLTVLVFFAASVGLTSQAEASHIRYGYLTWEYLGENNGQHEVAITHALGLRISFYGKLQVGDTVSGTLPELHFGDGSSQGFDPMEVVEIHEDDDWFLARRTLTHSYASEGPFLAYLEQSGWRLGGDHVNNSHGTIRMETVVDLTEGSGSATSGLPPIIDCEWGEDCEFTVPSSDPDGSDVNFRMATSSEAGGANGFVQPNNADIDGNTGLYTWSAADQPSTGSDGALYSTQIIMEKNNGNTRSAIDFFIRMLEDPDPLPTFSDYMLPSGIDLTVKTGSALDIWAEAGNSEAPEARFSISGVGVPPNADFPADSGNPAGGLFTWTPDPTHTGSHTMNIIAGNEAGQSVAPHNIGFNVSEFEDDDIRLAQAAYHLEVGQTHQSVVQRLDPNDGIVDVTDEATFEISSDAPSNDSVLSVDANGQVTGEAPGYAKVLATANGQTTPAFVTVSGVHPGSIPIFAEDSMLPDNPGETIVVPAGEELNLWIEAGAETSQEDITLLDDSSDLVEIPAGASFPGATGNPAGAEFSWTPSDSDAGTHTLRFEARNDYGITRTHTIDLLIQVEDDIRFTQWSYELAEGSTTTLVVEQLQPDGTYAVVTNSASISSSNTGVVTVNGDELTGVNIGSTTIIANVDGNQAIADVKVTETPPEATVYFDSQGGDSVAAITQPIDSSVEVPPGPSRTGYSFVDFNTEADASGTSYDPGDTFSMPTGGKTLYAQWNVNEYTVEFDSQGGNSVPSITQNFDTTVTVSSGPSRTGYTFTGWNSEADASGTSYEPNDTFSMPAGGKTLHAQWNVNEYTVEFDSHGGSSVASITQDFNSTVTVSSAPSRTGYTFVDFNTEADASGTSYDPGDTFSMPVGGKTLHAQWNINEYTVDFDSHGGSSVASITQDFQSTVEVPASPERIGYTFDHFNTAIDGTGTSYDPGDTFAMPATDQTLHAQWTINPYTVSFDSRGGNNVDEITQDFDSSVTAPPNPGRTGYSFHEWNTEANGTGTGYDPGDTFAMPAGGKTLYARWNINSYTVTFDSQGGSEVDDITQVYSNSIEIPAAPSQTGYAFVEWNTQIDGSGSGYAPGSTFWIPASNQTLFAQWESKTYTLSYEAGANGSITGPAHQTVLHGEDATQVEAQPDAGHHFQQWSDGVTDNPRLDTAVSSDLNVSATFEAGERHLRISGDDTGTVGDPIALMVQFEDETGESLEIVETMTVEIIGDGRLESTTLSGAETGVSMTTGETSADGTAELEIISETAGSLEVCVSTSSSPTASCQTVELSPQAADQLVLSTPQGPIIAGTPVTMGVQIADIYGNPVQKETDVELTVSGAAEFEPDASSTIEVTTSAQTGFVEATLNNTVAESITLSAQATVDSESLQKSLDLTFKPGPVDRLVVDAGEGTPNACEEAQLMVYAADSYDNPVDSLQTSIEVTLTASAEEGSAEIVATGLEDASWDSDASVTGMMPADGAASMVVTLDAAEALKLHWSAPDLAQDAGETGADLLSFQVGPLDAESSEIFSSGSQVFAAAGAVAITVIPRDACGLRLGGDRDVSLEASFGALTDVEDVGDGSYVAEFSTSPGECPDDAATIDASIDGVMLNAWAEVTAICAEVATDSPVSLAPESEAVEACAANDTFAQLHVTPVDPAGHPLPQGQDVRLVDNPPYLVAGEVSQHIDEQSGETSYTVTAGSNRCSRSGPLAVELKVGGVLLDTTVEIDFSCPSIADDGVRFVVSPDDVTTGEVDVRIELEDTCGNPGFGREMNLEAFGNINATVSQRSITTVDAYGESDDGTATVTISSDEAGEAGLRAEILDMVHESAGDLLTFTPSSEPVEINASDSGTVTPWGISGTGEPGATVVIEVDGEEVARVEVDEDGNWSWEPDTPLRDGQVVSARGLGQTNGPQVMVDRSAYRLAGGGCSTSQGAPPMGGLLLALGILLLFILRRSAGGRRPPVASLRRATVALLASGLILTLPTAAFADGFDLQQFHPDPDLKRGGFSAAGADISAPRTLSAGGVLNASRAPLVLLDEDDNRVSSPVSSQTTFHLLGTFSITNRAQIGVDIPLILHQGGEATISDGLMAPSVATSPGIGDLRLLPKVLLYTTREAHDDNGIAVAALLDMHLPTGDGEALQGGDLRLGPRIAADAVISHTLRLGVNLGYTYRSERQLVGQHVDDTLGWRIFGEVPLTDELHMTGEFVGYIPTAARNDGHHSTTEVVAGVKSFVGSTELVGGLGRGIFGSGYGSPDWRLFLGAGFSFDLHQ